MAEPPPAPPAWPGSEKPAAPAWDPDADKPMAAPVTTSANVTTPSGSLEAGYTPAVRHASMWDGCTCDCDPVGAIRSACDSPKWFCRGYIAFILFLTIILCIIIILVGLYASSYKGALAGVLVLSLIGPIVLGGLQAFTFCSDDFKDEAGTWCYMTASTYWIFVMVAFATCHAIVVVTAPNSLRNYHLLSVGKTFTGSMRDPAAFSGSYRFFNFSDAMFFPGTLYSPNGRNTRPVPMNQYYAYRCSKYSYKGFCATPLVPRDFSFVEPIRVWAGCSTPCGFEEDCDVLMRNQDYDCFRQLGSTDYGDAIFAYKHLNYQDQFRAAKNEIGLQTAFDAIYIRISNQGHVDDKMSRYKRYGVITEAVVFGLFFGISIIVMILIFVIN